MTTATTTPTHPNSRLRDFPVSFFSTTMGMTGLTLATQRIGLGDSVGVGLFGLTAGLFCLLALFYGSKAVLHGAAVIQEWNHPVRISFFPSMSISLILLSIAAHPVSPSLSAGLWYVGAALHLVLTVLVMTSWINHSRYEVVHTNPAWFIPVVGNILVPIAGVRHAPADVSWFFFSVGVLFWVVLLTIVVYRLIFHTPLPGKLVPTLFILLAPPSAGFISWMALTGQVDAFGRLLYFSACFIFLLLIAQLPKFAAQTFALSWWAYSFPLAAFTIATLIMAERSGAAFYHWAGTGLFGLLWLVIAGLAGRTVLAVARGEICTPEH